LLEIELSEKLRRSRDDLRSKLDSLATDEAGVSSTTDPAAQKQALESLVQDIQALQEQIDGEKACLTADGRQ
jgi:uncharacterized coiled-coil DUF342 family protein